MRIGLILDNLGAMLHAPIESLKNNLPVYVRSIPKMKVIIADKQAMSKAEAKRARKNARRLEVRK